MDFKSPVTVHHEDDTRQLAARFGHQLREGDIVALTGPLGAGKTTFVRGLLYGLGYLGRVRSPTFTLINSYDTVPPVHHADLYRLNTPDELIALGIDDLRETGGILLIEWADKIPGLAKIASWYVDIEPHGDSDRRTIRFSRS